MKAGAEGLTSLGRNAAPQSKAGPPEACRSGAAEPEEEAPS